MAHGVDSTLTETGYSYTVAYSCMCVTQVDKEHHSKNYAAHFHFVTNMSKIQISAIRYSIGYSIPGGP